MKIGVQLIHKSHINMAFYGNWFSGFSTTTILNYSVLKIPKKFYRTLENPVPGPMDLLCNLVRDCERFEPRSHFKSNLLLITRVDVVLNKTVVVDSDWHFSNLCGSHLQSWVVWHQMMVLYSGYWPDQSITPGCYQFTKYKNESQRAGPSVA